MEQTDSALAFLQGLAAELSSGTVDLPCFSNAVVRISAALMDPDTTSDQVVTIVGAEPRLAAQLIQTANSAAFNTSGKPVTDLRTAVTRIGQQMVQSIAVSHAIKQMGYEESLRAIEQPLADLWKRSVSVACICEIVAERTKVRADIAFLAGLLHGIGELYIMVHLATRSMESQIESSPVGFLDGWDASIAKAVLENWGFDDALCEAVADQRDYERKRQYEPGLTDVLIVSLVIADELDAAPPRDVAMEGITAFASIGLNAADCQTILGRADSRIALVTKALH